MKVIGNFTQTYKTNRMDVAKFFSQDVSLNYFLNQLDKKFFSFHKPEGNIQYCKDFANLIKQRFHGVEFLIYNEPIFSHVVHNHMKMLEEKGCTDVLFMYDDAMCTIPDQEKELGKVILDFYKNSEDIYLLNLSLKGERLIQCGVKPRQTRVVSAKHNLLAYEFLTTDYAKASFYEMDDSTYLGRMDIVQGLYDETYMTYTNTDQAEGYVRLKCEQYPISRWVLNKRMFRYCYYTGMHIYNKDKELRFLDRLIKFKVENHF